MVAEIPYLTSARDFLVERKKGSKKCAGAFSRSRLGPERKEGRRPDLP